MQANYFQYIIYVSLTACLSFLFSERCRVRAGSLLQSAVFSKCCILNDTFPCLASWLVITPCWNFVVKRLLAFPFGGFWKSWITTLMCRNYFLKYVIWLNTNLTMTAVRGIIFLCIHTNIYIYFFFYFFLLFFNLNDCVNDLLHPHQRNVIKL